MGAEACLGDGANSGVAGKVFPPEEEQEPLREEGTREGARTAVWLEWGCRESVGAGEGMRGGSGARSGLGILL